MSLSKTSGWILRAASLLFMAALIVAVGGRAKADDNKKKTESSQHNTGGGHPANNNAHVSNGAGAGNRTGGGNTSFHGNAVGQPGHQLNTGTHTTGGTTGGGNTGFHGNAVGQPIHSINGGGGAFGNGRSLSNAPVYHAPSGFTGKPIAGGGIAHFNPRTNTTVSTNPQGRITTIQRPGLTATHFGSNGYAGHIERTQPGGGRIVVNRGPYGGRQVEVMHPGGVRVVSYGRSGFVERPFRPGYVSRTYVYGGRTEVRVYGRYSYGGYHYYRYVPGFYFRPAFYGWAYRPWRAPIVFGWGWRGSPWFGFYGGYFAPAPYYPSASLWLTDYLLAENLRLAYENRQAANAEAAEQMPPPMAQNNGVVLTPEIKQMIADEVQQQLAAQQAAAAQPQAAAYSPADANVPPPALEPRMKVFVVSTAMNVTGADGDQSCPLTQGDVIERTSHVATADGRVAISVMSSKPGDCPVDFDSTLDVATLQDILNQFQEQIAAGMQQLASKQGQGGLPSGPAADPQQVAAGQAPAASDAQDLLSQENREADQTESEVRQTANGG